MTPATTTSPPPTAALPRTATNEAKERRQDARRLRRLDALRAEHGEAIFRFCLRLTDGRLADAEDLAQEVFVAACDGGLSRFAGRASVRTYLYKVALYRWRRWREERDRLPTAALDDAIAEARPDPRTTADPVERLSLEAAVAALPDALREAFLLVKAEGLTHKEAARALETPQGTVQWRVAEAVKRLRAALSAEFGEGKGDARK